jgi:hypothetical protein
MKIFGIGLNKTGTKTLGAAMEHLGFKNKSYDALLLEDFRTNNLLPIIKVARDFDSFEDWPWPLVFREMDQIFPDAKFILTIRKSPDIWFRSICNHSIITGPTEARKIVYGHSMPENFKEDYIQIYCRHNDLVKEYFQTKMDKLLVVCWENGSGWKDLSSFLKVPVPDVLFPHKNKS